MKVSRYQGRWTKNPTGRLSLAEALDFVKSRGGDVLDDVLWLVAEHEGWTLREAGLEDADARYFRFPLDDNDRDSPIKWEKLLNDQGKVPVFLRAEVLESDEHLLYVISHEFFELAELKRVFEERSGWMTYEALAHLIEPRLGGAIHEAAVSRSDDLVHRLREERGVEP